MDQNQQPGAVTEDLGPRGPEGPEGLGALLTLSSFSISAAEIETGKSVLRGSDPLRTVGSSSLSHCWHGNGHKPRSVSGSGGKGRSAQFYLH